MITKTLPISTKREEAERACNSAVVALHSIHRAAILAEDNKIDHARKLLHATRLLLERYSLCQKREGRQGGAKKQSLRACRASKYSDEQAEEYGNFIMISEDLDQVFRRVAYSGNSYDQVTH